MWTKLVSTRKVVSTLIQIFVLIPFPAFLRVMRPHRLPRYRQYSRQRPQEEGSRDQFQYIRAENNSAPLGFTQNHGYNEWHSTDVPPYRWSDSQGYIANTSSGYGDSPYGGQGTTITMVIGSHDTLITGLLSTTIISVTYSQETETTLMLVIVTGAPPEYPTIDNRRSHTIHLQ